MTCAVGSSETGHRPHKTRRVFQRIGLRILTCECPVACLGQRHSSPRRLVIDDVRVDECEALAGDAADGRTVGALFLRQKFDTIDAAEKRTGAAGWRFDILSEARQPLP